MKGVSMLVLCILVFVNMVAVLPTAIADIKPDGCAVETYYSQDQKSVSRTDNGNTVSQTMTVRRYGQTMLNCGYKEWLVAHTSYGTNHLQWSTTGAGQVKWYLPTEHGTVLFYEWTFYPNDGETKSTSGGPTTNGWATISFGSVGNPSPGDMNFYWKSSNLQSDYYTDSLDIVIQSCVSGCSSTTITLVVPYIQG